MVFRWLDSETLVAEELVGGVLKRFYLTGKESNGLGLPCEHRKGQVARGQEDASKGVKLRLALAWKCLVGNAAFPAYPRRHAN